MEDDIGTLKPKPSTLNPEACVREGWRWKSISERR